MKDSYNHIVPVRIRGPIQVNTATDDTNIDLAGFNSALLMFTVGAGTIDGTANRLDVRVSHADDDGTGSAGSYAHVTAKDVLGTSTVTAGVIGLLGAANTVSRWGYVGGKRFIRIELVDPGTTDVLASVHVLKSHGLDVPEIS